MQFKNIIATIAILCSAIFCENANAAMKDPIKYNNWSGGAFFNDKDNSFLACSVGTGFVNGTYFSIGINPSAVTNLGFSSTGWSLKPGAIISGQIKIDGNYFSTFNGVAINNQLVSISFQAGDIIFESLRKGRLLTVTSAIGSASYDLTDTARALSIVKECADKNKSLVRVNYDLQNWLNKNPWFNNPQYQNQKVIALSINSQILSEGGDPFSSKFYDEIDKRLALAGINLGPQSTITDTSDKSAENAKPEADFIISGSGFVVSADSKIITNNHVIASCTSPILLVASNGESFLGKVLARDAVNDLAIISSDFKSAYYATFRSSPVKIGEAATVAGYPLESTDLVVTNGIISSLSGLGNSTLYTISAPVNHGNSGGALFDAGGNVAGVIVATHIDAQNTNYAIKSSLVRDFLDRQYITYRTSDLTQSIPTTEVAGRAHLISVHLLCKGTPDQPDQK